MSPLCVCMFVCVLVCGPVIFYAILLSGHHGSSGGGFNRPSSSSGNHRNRLVRILQYTVRVTTLLGVTAAATHLVINQYNYYIITIPYPHDTTGVGTMMTGKLIFYVKVASNHLW